MRESISPVMERKKLICNKSSPVTGTGSWIRRAGYLESLCLLPGGLVQLGSDIAAVDMSSMETYAGNEEYAVSDYMSGMTKNIMISATARFLSYILPDKWVQEDEFTPILDGLIRRIEEACDG